MSSGEVRLVHTTGGIYMPTFGEVAHTHIALPAAKHAALMRVVEAARALLAQIGSADLKHADYEVDELKSSLSVYLATAPRRRGERT